MKAANTLRRVDATNKNNNKGNTMKHLFEEEQVYGMDEQEHEEELFTEEDDDDTLAIDIMLKQNFHAHTGKRMGDFMDRFHSTY
jgi:hypothetical protein